MKPLPPQTTAERRYEARRDARMEVIGVARLAGISWATIAKALDTYPAAVRRLYVRNGGEL